MSRGRFWFGLGLEGIEQRLRFEAALELGLAVYVALQMAACRGRLAEGQMRVRRGIVNLTVIGEVLQRVFRYGERVLQLTELAEGVTEPQPGGNIGGGETHGGAVGFTRSLQLPELHESHGRIVIGVGVGGIGLQDITELNERLRRLVFQQQLGRQLDRIPMGSICLRVGHNELVALLEALGATR